MIYEPDYEKIVSDAVQAIISNIVQDWVLVVVVVIGICFACAGAIILLEAMKYHFTPPQDHATLPDS